MKTLLDTPEIERRVYGVIWDADQREPYTEYDDLEEAKAVASAVNGYLVTRVIVPSKWTVLAVEAL